MSFTQIKETCLYVSDLDQTQGFYIGKMGLRLISRVDGRHIFFKVGSSVLLCFRPEVTREEATLPPHYAYGPQHIAFEVALSEYGRIKEQLEKKGIVITHVQPWAKGRFESFYFEDPDGHVLEIVPAGMWD